MKNEELKEMCREALKKNITLYVFICLELKKKVDIVFSKKTKTHTSNAFQKVKLFSFLNVISNLK